MSRIFTPFEVAGMALKNRIVMAPMLTYAAGEDGKVTHPHLAHYGARALGGVGLITSEVIAVEPFGRISPRDLGLWEDAQIEGLLRLSTMIHACGANCALQLAHAGRKSTLEHPAAPSPIAHSEQYRTPGALDIAAIETIVAAYASAAKRALETGFDALEIHAAHGYLLHTFLSPLSNRREDRYGGSDANRNRLLLEIVAAVREIWPPPRPLIVRLSVEDRVPGHTGGQTIDHAIGLCRALKDAGVDMLNISAGGLSPEFDGEILPGFLLPLAARMRCEFDLPIACNGSITSSELAEYALLSGAADLVCLGRELLRNPFWMLDAARAAGIEPELAIPVTLTRATSPYIRGH